MGINTLIRNQLQDFRESDVLHAADRIRELHKTAQSQKFINRFVFPMPTWAWYRIQQLLSAHQELHSLKDGIAISPVLCVFAGILYGLMWFQLLPFVLSLLVALLNPELANRLFQSYFTGQTLFRATVLIAMEVGVAAWALSAFKLTETFDTQYESLQQTYKQKWADGVVQTKTSQELMAMRPELVKSFTNKAMTLLLASEEFDYNQQEKIMNILMQALQNPESSTLPEQNSQFIEQSHQAIERSLPTPEPQDSLKAIPTYGENPFSDTNNDP